MLEFRHTVNNRDTPSSSYNTPPPAPSSSYNTPPPIQPQAPTSTGQPGGLASGLGAGLAGWSSSCWRPKLSYLRKKSISLDESGQYHNNIPGTGQFSHSNSVVIGNGGSRSPALHHHPGGYSSTGGLEASSSGYSSSGRLEPTLGGYSSLGRLNHYYPSPSSPTQSRGFSNHSSPRGQSRVDLNLGSRNSSPAPVLPVPGAPTPLKARQLPCSIYVVLYTFQQQREDELGITAGSTVHILDTQDTEWWKGRCTLTGASGYLPSSYLVRALPAERVYRVNQHCSLFGKTGEMFALALDQIVLGLPPTDGESDIIVRTGEGGSQARRGRVPSRCLTQF